MELLGGRGRSGLEVAARTSLSWVQRRRAVKVRADPSPRWTDVRPARPRRRSRRAPPSLRRASSRAAGSPACPTRSAGRAWPSRRRRTWSAPRPAGGCARRRAGPWPAARPASSPGGGCPRRRGGRARRRSCAAHRPTRLERPAAGARLRAGRARRGCCRAAPRRRLRAGARAPRRAAPAGRGTSVGLPRALPSRSTWARAGRRPAALRRRSWAERGGPSGRRRAARGGWPCSPRRSR